MAGDFGPAKARPRNRPPTTRISVFRAAAYETSAPSDGFGDDDRICGESCVRLAAPLRAALFADSAQPPPVGPCDLSEYQPVPVHFAPELSRVCCAYHEIGGASFL